MIIKLKIFLFLFLCFFVQLFPQTPAGAGSNVSSNSVINILETPQTDEDDYNILNGKTIKDIEIIPIDVSGGDIANYEVKNISWFGNLTNSLHFKTRDWVIRNRLLFKEGDKFDSELISESERLLRTSGYFLDARIRISEKSYNIDSVSVLVVTKDKWTIIPLFGYDTQRKNGYFGLRDDNFLGLGHLLSTTFTHDQDQSVGWGGTIDYTASNIIGSYINGHVAFEKNGEIDYKSFGFTRPFFSTEVDWFGGANFEWEKGIYRFVNESGVLQNHFYGNNNQDIWVGRSFPFWFGPDLFKRKTKITISGRIARTQFSDKPLISENLNRLFENKTIYLGSVGVINQRFYQDFFIENYGTTEDIPIGGIIILTAGSEHGGPLNRWYSSAEAIYSRRFEDFGYLSTKLILSGFRNKNVWEQNIFNLNFLYHSPLIIKDNWKYRFLFQNDFLIGFNRFEGERIYLDRHNGMRGFDKYAVSGTKKNVLNLELRIFSPFQPLGFVLGGIVFTDLGLIGDQRNSITKSKIYQSYGIGLRTMNESITQTDFEIAIVYNPITPGINKDSFKILFSSTIVLGKRSFGSFKPQVVEFVEQE